MNAIVATDKNWGIGCEGKLLFHIPEDMKFFKEKTTGNVVLMGRKTLESLPGGNPLPNRTNLVLTNSTAFQAYGVNFYKGNTKNIESMFAKYDPDDIFICGGESIYKYYLSRCDKVYRTLYNDTFIADAHFPSLPRHNFVFKKMIKQSEYNGHEVYFEEWENQGLDSYFFTGQIEDRNHSEVRNEFVSRDGTTWRTPYGYPCDDTVMGEYAQIVRDGIFIDEYTDEIDAGIFRTSLRYVQSGRIATLDGYGGNEESSSKRVHHYVRMLCTEV